VKPGTNNAAEKRRKELNRQKWQQAKAERKHQRQAERQSRLSDDPEEDPDLAGIVPGPQSTQETEGAPVDVAVPDSSPPK
jgi:hypothetical protein